MEQILFLFKISILITGYDKDPTPEPINEKSVAREILD